MMLPSDSRIYTLYRWVPSYLPYLLQSAKSPSVKPHFCIITYTRIHNLYISWFLITMKTKEQEHNMNNMYEKDNN